MSNPLLSMLGSICRTTEAVITEGGDAVIGTMSTVNHAVTAMEGETAKAAADSLKGDFDLDEYKENLAKLKALRSLR